MRLWGKAYLDTSGRREASLRLLAEGGCIPGLQGWRVISVVFLLQFCRDSGFWWVVILHVFRITFATWVLHMYVIASVAYQAEFRDGRPPVFRRSHLCLQLLEQERPELAAPDGGPGSSVFHDFEPGTSGNYCATQLLALSTQAIAPSYATPDQHRPVQTHLMPRQIHTASASQ